MMLVEVTRTKSGVVVDFEPRTQRNRKKVCVKVQATEFVSKAGEKTMRDYQRASAMFPPLPHKKILELSKKFVEGRQAEVELIINNVIKDQLGEGKWTVEKVSKHLDEILAAFSALVDNEDGRYPKDMVTALRNEYENMSLYPVPYILSMHMDARARRSRKRTAGRGQEALATIIEHNLQLAMSIVSKLMRCSSRAREVGFSELTSVANVGLVLGAREFDPEQGRRFSTYATYHIKAQLYSYLHQEDGNCGILGETAHEKKQTAAITAMTACFTSKYGRPPTLLELASLTDIAPKIIKRKQAEAVLHVQTINAPASGRSSYGEDNGVTLCDIIADKRDDEAQEELDSFLQEIYDFIETRLSGDDKTIVIDMFGFSGDTKTIASIAREVGVSTTTLTNRWKKIQERLVAELEMLGYSESMVVEILAEMATKSSLSGGKPGGACY